MEYKTGSAYIDEIADARWSLDADGLLPIPEAPGLGLELNFEAVSRFTRGEPLFDGQSPLSLVP